jgi:hypothetical protein
MMPLAKFTTPWDIPGKHDRLAVVKAQYDPENFFNVNQNIKPAASSAAV